VNSEIIIQFQTEIFFYDGNLRDEKDDGFAMDVNIAACLVDGVNSSDTMSEVGFVDSLLRTKLPFL
jgi:hypothetical protein